MAEQKAVGPMVGTPEAALQIAQEQLGSLVEMVSRKSDASKPWDWVTVRHRLSLLQRGLVLVGERLGSSPAGTAAERRRSPESPVFVVLDCGIPETLVVGSEEWGFESIHLDGLKDDDDQWDALSDAAQAYVRQIDPELADDCVARSKAKDKHLYGI